MKGDSGDPDTAAQVSSGGSQLHLSPGLTEAPENSCWRRSGALEAWGAWSGSEVQRRLAKCLGHSPLVVGPQTK